MIHKNDGLDDSSPKNCTIGKNNPLDQKGQYLNLLENQDLTVFNDMDPTDQKELEGIDQSILDDINQIFKTWWIFTSLSNLKSKYYKLMAKTKL